MFDKQKVAQSFGRAAGKYDALADVQLDIAFDALDLMPLHCATGLDLGCGTGRVSSLLQQRCDRLVGLDLAEGMVSHARQKYGENVHWMAGDAEALPFANEVFDGVYSSMALQWCNQPQAMLNELFRTMRTGGKGVLAILCAGSLFELQQSWAPIDSGRHVNRFISSDMYASMASKAGFLVQCQTRDYTTWHNNIRQLLASIKGIGANVVEPGKQKKAFDRQVLAKLSQSYQSQFAPEGPLPLTYKVCMLSLEKPLDPQ